MHYCVCLGLQASTRTRSDRRRALAAQRQKIRTEQFSGILTTNHRVRGIRYPVRCADNQHQEKNHQGLAAPADSGAGPSTITAAPASHAQPCKEHTAELLPPAKRQKRAPRSRTAAGNQAGPSRTAKSKPTFGAKQCPRDECDNLYERDTNAARCILLCGLWWLAGLPGRPPLLDWRSKEEKRVLGLRRTITLLTRELNAEIRKLKKEPSTDRLHLFEICARVKEDVKDDAELLVAGSQGSVQLLNQCPQVQGVLSKVCLQYAKLQAKAAAADSKFPLT